MIEENPQIVTDRRTVGLVCKPDRPEIEPIANQVAEFLISNNLNVQVDQGSCNVLQKRAQPTLIEEMDVDFVVTIGRLPLGFVQTIPSKGHRFQLIVGKEYIIEIVTDNPMRGYRKRNWIAQ